MRDKLKFKLYFFTVLSVILVSLTANFVLADENNNVDNKNNEQNIDSNTEKYEMDSMFDIKMSSGSYKFSQDEKDIYLPFVRFASDRIVIDKEVPKMGFTFTSKTIDVNSKTESIQVLFSQDTVRINNEMEYAIIYSDGDVVIDSNISKSAIVFASGTITLTEKAVVNDDIIAYGGTLDIKGKVNGSVIGNVNNVKINGTINKDLRILGNNVALSDDSKISGNIYLKTYNKDLKLSDKYKDVKIKVVEPKSSNIWKQIVNIMIYSIVFVLLYVILDKLTKKKMFEDMTNKVKAHPTFVILAGSVALLAIPIVIPLLIILMFFKLWIITVPLLLIYITYLVTVIILSKFIVGNVIYKYISEKFSEQINGVYGLISLFVIYLCLFAICKIPVVGVYIELSMCIISAGVVFTAIFRKKEKGKIEQIISDKSNSKSKSNSSKKNK